MVAIDYAQEKSKRRKKLVKIHKVIAGFEPIQFTNLFPTWKKRTDVTQIQEKVRDFLEITSINCKLECFVF